MSKLSIFLLIIIGVFIFVLGGGVGIMYQEQIIKDTSQAETIQITPQITSATIKTLLSKVISPIIASGKAVKIEKRNITLKDKTESLVISVKENSSVYSSEQVVDQDGEDTNSDSVKKIVEFKDVKVGDNLNIIFKLLLDGTLETQSVIIFPPDSPPIQDSKIDRGSIRR